MRVAGVERAASPVALAFVRSTALSMVRYGAAAGCEPWRGK
jgi:hypothetical protein